MTICYDKTFFNCKSLEKVSFPNDVISVGTSAFYNCNNLTSINIPNTLTSIGQDAFTNCNKLTSISLAGVKDIGNSAFGNCIALEKVDRLNGNVTDITFETVGEYAFANTNLKTAKLTLRASADRTWWGEYCFASCYNLETIEFLSSCYLGSHMFEHCSKLKNVRFDTGAISYVGKYVFKDCTALQSITFPKQQFSFLKGFFDGCISLKEVKFDDYGEGSEFTYVQKSTFNGCSSLTSVEFPQSLNQLTYIEDAALSNCALTSINLHGIDSSELFEVNDDIKEDILFGKIYDIRIIPGSSNGISEFEKYWNIIQKKNLDYCIIYDRFWIDNIIGSWNDEKDNYQSNTKIGTYQHTDLFQDISKRKKALFIRLTDWLGSEKYDKMEPNGRSYSNSEIQQFIRNAINTRKKLYDEKKYDKDCLLYLYKILEIPGIDGLIKNSYNPCCCICGYKKNEKFKYNGITNIELFENIVLQKFQSSSRDFEVCETRCVCINDTLLKTGFFRLNHDCLVYTKDRQTKATACTFVYDSSKVIPYNPPYEYAADMTTKSNFKTPYQLCNGYSSMKAAHIAGKNPWYYNVKEVVQQAKDTNTPVLCFYSYETCTPCQSFKANIYEAADFQDWIMKQKFLVCRIEADKPKAYDRELLYCEDELSRDALNYQKDGASGPLAYNGFGEVLGKGYFKDVGTTNKNLTPPVLIFYYKDASGNLISHYDYSLHTLKKYFDCERIGIEGVKQMIKSLCLYHFDNNNLSKAEYVVDANKEFNKYDYDTESDNPYRIKENAITLDVWKALEGKDKTRVNALEAMKNILEATGANKYPEYIGDCLFGDMDWISKTFSEEDLSILGSTESADEMNQILDKEFIYIGSKCYKMVVDKNKKVTAETPCSAEAILYKYDFVEKPYEPPKSTITVNLYCLGPTVTVQMKYYPSDKEQTYTSNKITFDADGYIGTKISGYIGTKPIYHTNPAIQGYTTKNEFVIQVTIPANTRGNIIIDDDWSEC